MKKNIILVVSAAMLMFASVSCSNSGSKKKEVEKKIVKIEIKVKKELVTFESEDELTVTADLYTHENKTDLPFIILFHQAGFSRGEYKETADNFLDLGFNCLAVDQRSGDQVNGVMNETHKRAKDKGLPTAYIDAMPDIEAAINYVRDGFEPEKLYILGSSYSSVLSIIYAAQNPDAVDGVLAFSPGEYFEYDERSVADYAAELLTPIFITSAKSEYENWESIYNAISDGGKTKFIPKVESIHGSRALWESTEGSKECWRAVNQFFKSDR